MEYDPCGFLKGEKSANWNYKRSKHTNLEKADMLSLRLQVGIVPTEATDTFREG
jgi:hypothetical protein